MQKPEEMHVDRRYTGAPLEIGRRSQITFIEGTSFLKLVRVLPIFRRSEKAPAGLVDDPVTTGGMANRSSFTLLN